VTTLIPEPKTTHPTSSPLPATIADLAPAERIPAGPDAEDVTVQTQPTPAGPPALLVEHVTKRFSVDRRKPPVLAIDDVSLRLERGSIQGILGANGSGKSTLIRLVSGLLTLDQGKVEVFGYDIERDELAVKRLINRVSVDAAFFKKLSPMENLLFAARLYGLDGTQAKHEATAILSRLGIAQNRLGRPVEQMSRRADHRPRPAQQARRPGVHRGRQRRERRDDRPHDARHGRGGAPLRADHDPRRGSGRRRGHARGAQATRRRAARAAADAGVGVHGLHRSLPRRGRRGRRRQRLITTHANRQAPAARKEVRR
jgi:hypothetical protein